MKNDYGWATEGKATCGQSIGVTREIIAKLADEAEGERPLLGLLFYADETLERIDYELVAMNADDFAEIMGDNARLRSELADAQERLANLTAGTESIATGSPMSPGSAAELVRRAQEEAAALRRDNESLLALVATSGVLTKHQRELAVVGMPSKELWPCYVIDIRKSFTQPSSATQERAWYVSASGEVDRLMVHTVRIDRGIGLTDRIFLNEQIVRCGELRVNGVLECRVTDGRGPTQPQPQPFTGTTETSA
jgi:hypothetical protein